MKNTETSSSERLTYEQTEMIQELVNCALACDSCNAGSLKESHADLFIRSLYLTRDCADVCILGSRLIMRDSEIAEQFLRICEETCRICAEECRKHESEDCKICAEACESCADCCHGYHEKVSGKSRYSAH